jgi:hypothetical protein
MRHNLLKSIAAAGTLFFGLSYSPAMAQDRDDQSWYQNRDSFYHGEWRMRMFDRVRDDLDHVQASAFSGSDQYRISRTKDQLSSLQSELTAGRYDQPQLDDVIASLNRVIADNHLSARERDILTDDLNRMRDYREHHADWR